MEKSAFTPVESSSRDLHTPAFECITPAPAPQGSELPVFMNLQLRQGGIRTPTQEELLEKLRRIDENLSALSNQMLRQQEVICNVLRLTSQSYGKYQRDLTEIISEVVNKLQRDMAELKSKTTGMSPEILTSLAVLMHETSKQLTSQRDFRIFIFYVLLVFLLLVKKKY